MTIASILKSKGGEVTTARADVPVREILARLHEHRIGAIVIEENGRPAGIVSERDVVRCLHEHGAAVLDSPAGAIMSAPVVTASPTDSVIRAMAVMTDRRIRHLPVVDAGRLIGIVSIGDLVKRRIEDAEHETEMLKGYITAA